MASKCDESNGTTDDILDMILDDVHREVTKGENFKPRKHHLSCIEEEESLGNESSALASIHKNADCMTTEDHEFAVTSKRRGSAITEGEAKFLLDANDLIKSIQNSIAVRHQMKHDDQIDSIPLESADDCEKVSSDNSSDTTESAHEIQSRNSSTHSSFELLSDNADHEGSDWFFVKQGELLKLIVSCIQSFV